MTRDELNFVMNEFGCYFFPLTSLIETVKIKDKKGKVKNYKKADFLKAATDYGSSIDSSIHFTFVDDLFQTADDFAFDLLYLR